MLKQEIKKIDKIDKIMQKMINQILLQILRIILEYQKLNPKLKWKSLKQQGYYKRINLINVILGKWNDLTDQWID